MWELQASSAVSCWSHREAHAPPAPSPNRRSPAQRLPGSLELGDPLNDSMGLGHLQACAGHPVKDRQASSKTKGAHSCFGHIAIPR